MNGSRSSTKRHQKEDSLAISKAAINNFMNVSQGRDSSPPKTGKGDRLNSRDKKTRKKSNSKLNTFGTSKNNVLKELLQMKQEQKLNRHKPNTKSGGLAQETPGGPIGSGTAFKNRKMSADPNRSEKNALKGVGRTDRSRKSNSNKPSQRISRADSRETSTRSHKEDSKSAANDQPANNQSVEADENAVKEDVNIVTKFAFATRVGYIPNNPYKVNQDAYVLNPNLLKLPAFHYFGV